MKKKSKVKGNLLSINFFIKIVTLCISLLGLFLALPSFKINSPSSDSNINSPQTIIKGNGNTIDNSIDLDNIKGTKIPSSESIPFNSEMTDWSEDSNYFEKNGDYFCANNQNFPRPHFWYDSKIPINFKLLSVSFFAKRKTLNHSSASFITIGRDPLISSLELPYSSSQTIKFKKFNESSASPTPDTPQSLSDPVKENTLVNVNLSQTIVGNMLNLTYKVNYISALTGEKVENPFSFSQIPLRSFDSKDLYVEFGFGIENGSCVKPVSYIINY